MSTAFIPSRMQITTDRYKMMIAAGVLTKYDRVELIDGDLLNMTPIGTKHSAITSRLHELFVLAVSRAATVVNSKGDLVASLAFPDVKIAVGDLFG